MFFFKALWYTMSTIGAASIGLFIIMVLSIFNEEHIKQVIGYRNYCIMLGVYALIALPLAATLNGGTSGDFLFYLGCLCPALWHLSNLLEKDFLAQRASLPAAPAQIPAAAPQLDQPQQAFRVDASGPAYAPAPASLGTDFDVPPQR